MFIPSLGKHLIWTTLLYTLSFAAQDDVSRLEKAEKVSEEWDLLPVTKIGNCLPEFLHPICAKDSLTRKEAISEMEKILKDPKYIDTISLERGHFFKITPSDGATILILGTAHIMPLFYRRKLNDENVFRQIVQDSGIKTVYYELDPSTWYRVYNPQETGGFHLIGSYEHEMQKSLEDLGLNYGGLETVQNREEIKRKLGSYAEFTERNQAAVQIRAYLSGSRYMSQFPRLLRGADNVIIQRNLHWMRTVEHQAEKNESTLLVVGTAHLYGEHGLLNLCAAKDWKVESQPFDEDDNGTWPWPTSVRWDLSTCPRFRGMVEYFHHAEGWEIDTRDLPKPDRDLTDYAKWTTHNCYDPDFKLPDLILDVSDNDSGTESDSGKVSTSESDADDIPCYD